MLKCGRKRKEKRSQINTAQSREGCHLGVNLLFPSPSCGVSFLFSFFFFCDIKMALFEEAAPRHEPAAACQEEPRGEV